MDLKVGENSRTLPGLRLSNPYNKLWSAGQDRPVSPVCVPPACERPSSVQLPVQMETSSPGRESSSTIPDFLDPSNPANITVPRPQGRKTPELGTVLVPPAVPPRPKAAGLSEGRTTSGGQEFRQALSLTSDGDLLGPTKVSEDSLDLLSLLDPLSNSTAPTERLDISTSTACKPPLPPRLYPQSLPPFTLPPQISLNPFAPPLQHYSPTVSGNPFSAVCGPPPGSYINTSSQPLSFSTLPGLYRQPSPGSSTLPPSHGLSQSAFQAAFPPSVSPLPHSSDSSHALSSLVDSTSVFSTSVNALPKPLQAQGENQKAKDPFGDLLSLATPVTPQKKKVEDLRRKWETFD